MKSGIYRNFFKKVPCTLKNSLRPYIPCACGNRLLQSFWQQIQDLRFKINAIEILFDKVLENQNLNNITYNFLSKMQWNCILPKVLLDFFQKIAGCGTETHGFNQSDKFIFINLKSLKINRFCDNIGIWIKYNLRGRVKFPTGGKSPRA